MLIEFHDDSPRIEMEYLMDRALKQRLVGASVLIAVAVLVLPMLLSGRPENKNQQTQKIQIPPQPPELSFETRRYPIGDKEPESPLKQEDSGQDKPVRQLPAPRSAPVKIEVPDTSAELPDPVSPDTVSPETVSSDTVSAEPDSSGAEPAALPEVSKPVPAQAANVSDSGRYVVQVASFGSLDNATRLSTSLKSSGYPVMTDSVKSAVGKLHRVRIGPYASEAEANRAALELEAKIDGVKPRVMDLQPEKSAQVTTPSDPLVRWVVQVGSFSSAENANRLVASLRLDGLSAYQETVTSSGSSIYRVRVGPFLERDEAIKVERRVREEMSLNGVVMSAE
jgi:DedD protein